MGSSGTGVKQGDPAGPPLYFAVSTHGLFCSIRDAIERVATEYFPLLPSFAGVTAICDDLQVVSDPQLALPVAEVVQRKILESGRSLNIAKCRILVHPDGCVATALAPRLMRCSPYRDCRGKVARSAHRHGTIPYGLR